MRIITGSSGFIGTNFVDMVAKKACVPGRGGVGGTVYPYSSLSQTKISEQTISKEIVNPDVSASHRIINNDTNVSKVLIEGILTGKIINSGTVEDYYEITQEIASAIEGTKRESEAKKQKKKPLTPTLVEQTRSEELGSQKLLQTHNSNYYRSLCEGIIPECTHNHQYLTINHKYLNNPEVLRELLTKVYRTYQEPFEVVHFSSYGNHSSQQDWEGTFDALKGGINLLDVIKDFPVKSIVMVGSSSEYGPKTEVMSESDVLEPDTFYAAAKAAQTHFSLVMAQKYDLPLTVVRPFSVYGPHEADFRFVPTIIKNAFYYRNMPLAMGWHDWIYVEDFIRGLLMAEFFSASITKGKIVNIGTGKQYSNRVILQKMENIMDRQINYSLVGKIRNYDKKKWVADTKVLNDLGWKPKETIDTGLLKTYDWYRRKYLLEKKRISR